MTAYTGWIYADSAWFGFGIGVNLGMLSSGFRGIGQMQSYNIFFDVVELDMRVNDLLTVTDDKSQFMIFPIMPPLLTLLSP